MQIYRSNRAEHLARGLAAVLSSPSGGPMDPEWVVVPSRGMERWLRMQLAARLGIAAHIDFGFPATLVSRAFAAASAIDAEALETWSPARLTWRILALLPELLPDPAFAPLRAYLAHEQDGRLRFQIAQRIAEVFDRYLTWRVEMVLEWEQGTFDREDWQPLLFRALSEAAGAPHQGALAQRFFAAMEEEHPDLGDLPARICLFGISALPPFHVQVLAALSKHRQIHLFGLSPSRQYMADTAVEPGDAPADHRLLSSLGRLGRDFQWALEQHAPEAQEPVGAALFEEPGQASLLARLQSDMLDLLPRGRGGLPPHPVAKEDRSLRLHACHGPMRQVEILHDELLRLFDALPGLAPRDIIVMTPDIEAFAPLVQAVFQRAPGAAGPPGIPFRIADRVLKKENPLAEALLALLELLRGRLPASEVLDLMGLPPVRERFGFDPEEIDTLRTWVREAGVRWGRDPAHRLDHGQPLYDENTWRFGLDRLLVGAAMPGEGLHTFAGILPYDEIEGQATGLLGRLLAFWEALVLSAEEVRDPASATDWRTRTVALLDRMLAWEEDDARQAQQVRDTLADLSEGAEEAGYIEPFGVEILLDLLTGRFGESRGSRGFLTGAVTICAMVPMRSIPFRVVCLLGMDDGAFPRSDPRLGFDHMARARKRGDRSPREEDRTLFLEALLSARDAVVLTWTGRSPRTNEPLPPAVPVVELIDHLLEAFTLEGAEDPAALRAHLVAEHPLQPFSPAAFDTDDRLRGFDPTWLATARRLLGARVEPAPFVHAPVEVDQPEGEETVVALDDLVRFFRNPTAFLLNRRLGLWLGREALSVDDREPAELNAFERYALGRVLLEWALEGHDLSEAEHLARARGVLPPGTPGTFVFEGIRAEVLPVAARAQALRGEQRRPPAEVDLHIDGLRLLGRVGDRWTSGPVLAQYGRVQPRHELGLWIRHLALSAAGIAEPSALVGRGRGAEATDERRLLPQQDARARLGELLALWRAGQERPLPFFPATSRAWAASVGEAPEATEKAIKAAERAWWPQGSRPGEAEEPHVQRVFQGSEPFRPGVGVPGLEPQPGEAFGELASKVWGPLLIAFAAE